MKKQNRSAWLSLTLVYIFGALLIVLAFTAPLLVRTYIELTVRPETMFLPVTTAFYMIFPLAAATLVALARLLRRILRGEVFVSANVAALRLISYLLYAAALVLFVAGFFYGPFFILTAAAAFIATVVRVVKNCFDAAVLLKDENELTI